jgi:hypothetical protein
MRCCISLLHVVLVYMLSIVDVSGDMLAGAVVGPPERVSGQAAWVSHVSLQQASTPGSVILILLLGTEHRGYAPCPEFGPVCCLGEQLRSRVWGGDVDVLDGIKTLCETGGGGLWAGVMAPLSDRNTTDAGFDMDDMRDTWRVATSVDGLRDVRVLTLVVQVWGGCDGGIDRTCVVRLQSFEQLLQVDTSNAQRVSSVSIPTHCTSDKPDQSFWVPSTDPSVCEWFCVSGFTQCPGHVTGSTRPPVCYELPLFGATLHVTAAVRVNVAPDDSTLDQLSADIAARFRGAGVSRVDECAVVVRDNIRNAHNLAQADLPVVNGRIRVIADSYYDGTSIRIANATDPPNEPIPIELDDIDDRSLAGFLEMTVLVYSNTTDISLATQAVLLRYLLFDALRTMVGAVSEDSNSNAVLYIGDVHGVMRRKPVDEPSLSFTHTVILLAWVSLLGALSISSIFGSWRCTSGTKSVAQSYEDEMIPLPRQEWCGEHSPRDRVLLGVVFLFIAGIIPVTVIVYTTFVLPRMMSADGEVHPFVMLGWIWVMFVGSTLAMVSCCFVAKCVRRRLVG